MIKKLIPKENLLFWVVSIITISGALFIRLHGLSDYYYTSDEVWHLVVASQKNLVGIIDYNFAEELHPPLSPIIWHYMLKISDNGLWIRSASYIPSILIIPSIYIFGRIFVGEVAAVAMAIIAAFGLLSVVSGSVVRAYPLMVLALVWAGIFTHKYLKSPKLRYFGYYFICVFLALELNHAAFIMIFTFGLIFMWVSFKNRAKVDFAIITSGHIFLAACLVFYIETLKYYEHIPGNYGAFSVYNNIIEFLFNSIIKLGVFCSELIYFETAHLGEVLTALAIIIVPYFLIKKKNWFLLYIIFAPLVIVCIFDYFRIYPFSSISRHNLFMFTSGTSILGYFIQLMYNYIKNLGNLVNQHNSTPMHLIWSKRDIDLTQAIYISIAKKLPEFSNYIRKHKKILFSIFVISIPSGLTIGDYCLGSFRDLQKSGREFELRKSDFEKSIEYIKKFQTQDNNILVTEKEILWFFLFTERNHHPKDEMITESFGHFTSDNYSFYFGNYSNLFMTLYAEEKIFSSLIEHLKYTKEINEVKNITYFHFGGTVTAFDSVLYPKFIQNKVPGVNKKWLHEKIKIRLEEDYDFSWKVLTSDQVTTKIFLKDYRYISNIVILGMTPQFLEENLIGKDFVDLDDMFNKAVKEK